MARASHCPIRHRVTFTRLRISWPIESYVTVAKIRLRRYFLAKSDRSVEKNRKSPFYIFMTAGVNAKMFIFSDSFLNEPFYTWKAAWYLWRPSRRVFPWWRRRQMKRCLPFVSEAALARYTASPLTKALTGDHNKVDSSNVYSMKILKCPKKLYKNINIAPTVRQAVIVHIIRGSRTNFILPSLPTNLSCRRQRNDMWTVSCARLPSGGGVWFSPSGLLLNTVSGCAHLKGQQAEWIAEARCMNTFDWMDSSFSLVAFTYQRQKVSKNAFVRHAFSSHPTQQLKLPINYIVMTVVKGNPITWRKRPCERCENGGCYCLGRYLETFWYGELVML